MRQETFDADFFFFFLSHHSSNMFWSRFFKIFVVRYILNNTTYMGDAFTENIHAKLHLNHIIVA